MFYNRKFSKRIFWNLEFVFQVSYKQYNDESQNLDVECQLLIPQTRNENENEGKEWKSFEKCHLVHDITSFAVTFVMTVLGAWYVKANVDIALLIVVITEMQLFGFLLKSTYYLHVHPWEKLNPNYKKFVTAHQVLTVLYVLGILTTVIYYAVTSTIKIFTITIIFLFIPIGLVSCDLIRLASTYETTVLVSL